MSIRTVAGVFFIFLLGSPFTGCGTPRHDAISVDVTPVAVTLVKVGQTIQFIAQAQLNQTVGLSDVTKTVVWQSSIPSVATIDANGLATAVACGTTTITAHAPNGVTGQAELTSNCSVPPDGVLESITLFPSNPTIAEIAQTTQFAALGTFSTTTTDVTLFSKWASSSPEIATIDANTGTAIAVSCGTTTITAQDGAVIGQTSLTVACSIPDRVELDIVKTGTTAARITSSPKGIDCGNPDLGQSACDTLMDKGTGVVLTATPAPVSWTNCDQVLSANTCSLTLLPDPACSSATGLAACRIVKANF